MGRIRKKLIALLFVFSLLATACGEAAPSAPIETEPQNAEYTGEGLPEKQNLFENDYNVLWETLESAYPYLPYLEEQGIDIEGLRRRYAAELESVDSEDEFYALVQCLLGELRNFAHLNLVTPEMYQSYYYIYVLNDGLVDEDYSAPFKAVLLSPNLSERYQPPESLESYEAQETAEPGSGASFMYYSDCDALYIKIPSFAQEMVEKDSGIVYDTLEEYPKAEHIIFDIRGNGGGSDLYWRNNLVAPFGGQYEFCYRSYYRSSEIFNSYYTALETVPVSDIGDAPEWVEKLELDRCYAVEMVLPGESGDEVLPGEYKRWLLTDEVVFSSSDKFAVFCKSTGWATVIGKRTAGDGLGSTPVLVMLPDSGLLVRFSGEVSENPNGTINAVAGTSPDVLCVKGETALERCLELIRGN